MTSFEAIEKALLAKCWRYDSESDGFFDDHRRLSYRQVLALVPGMTLGELASYVNHKHEQLKRARK